MASRSEKFFVRFINDKERYSIITAANLPKAVEHCKKYRSDCIVSRMDDKSLSPSIALALRMEYRLEDIPERSTYELVYADENKQPASKFIEACEAELKDKANIAFQETAGLIYQIGGERILVKKKNGKNVPICIIYKKGAKKTGLSLLKEKSE